MTEIKRHDCRQILVPVDVCRLEFSGVQPYDTDAIKTRTIGTTVRGEKVVVWKDKNGLITTIELASREKPCMDEEDCAFYGIDK